MRLEMQFPILLLAAMLFIGCTQQPQGPAPNQTTNQTPAQTNQTSQAQASLRVTVYNASDPLKPLARMTVMIYKIDGKEYVLFKTMKTDLSGVADFGSGDITAGKAVVNESNYTGSTTFGTPGAVSVYLLPIKPKESEPVTYSNYAMKRFVSADYMVYGAFFANFSGLTRASRFFLALTSTPPSTAKPLEVLFSNSTNCYADAMKNNFTSYQHYVTFTPDPVELQTYEIENGSFVFKCIAVNDIGKNNYLWYVNNAWLTLNGEKLLSG